MSATAVRLHDCEIGLPEDMDRPFRDLHTVPEPWLRAWVDSGILDEKTYAEESDRRRSLRRITGDSEWFR